MSAPFLISVFTVSLCPSWLAMYRGVAPVCVRGISDEHTEWVYHKLTPSLHCVAGWCQLHSSPVHPLPHCVLLDWLWREEMPHSVMECINQLTIVPLVPRLLLANSNPHCACTPRVNYAGHYALLSTHLSIRLWLCNQHSCCTTHV